MGFVDHIRENGFTGLGRLFGGGHDDDDRMETGIVGGPAAQSKKKRASGGGLWGVAWVDEDGTGTPNIVLRSLEVFFPFTNLWIYVGIDTFQASWGVGPSFLTGLGIFFNVETLIAAGILLAAPLLYERFDFLRGTARALRQIRVAIIINSIHVVFMFLMALITTISAYTGGCQDASSDPHASLKGYTDAMGPFCRNKRAGSAFFWFNLLAWSFSLFLTFLNFRHIRKYPQSQAFDIPDASSAPEFVYHETNEHEEEDGYGGVAQASESTAAGGYRPSGDYYGGQVFAEGYPTSARMGGRQPEENVYHHPRIEDPFADRQQGQALFGREGEDPYDAVRRSMDAAYNR